jgi:hypothetical protein
VTEDNAHLLEGKKVSLMFRIPLPHPSARTGKMYTLVEDEARVQVVRDYLPAGPVYDDDGNPVLDTKGKPKVRLDDQVDFIAIEGGCRSVRVKDIIDVS